MTVTFNRDGNIWRCTVVVRCRYYSGSCLTPDGAASDAIYSMWHLTDYVRLKAVEAVREALANLSSPGSPDS
jgi:hypothetical protein